MYVSVGVFSKDNNWSSHLSASIWNYLMIKEAAADWLNLVHRWSCTIENICNKWNGLFVCFTKLSFYFCLCLVLALTLSPQLCQQCLQSLLFSLHRWRLSSIYFSNSFPFSSQVFSEIHSLLLSFSHFCHFYGNFRSKQPSLLCCFSPQSWRTGYVSRSVPVTSWPSLLLQTCNRFFKFTFTFLIFFT